MITVVGLGFNDGSVTLRGYERIKSAEKVVLRTKRTPPSKAFSAYDSFDELYKRANDFDELNRMIADELIRIGQDADLVYCVDGDGYKDSSVVELCKRTKVEIIAAPFDLHILPSTACVYMSAYDLGSGVYPDPKLPVCIYNIDDANIASEVKLFLMRFYDPEAKILLVTGSAQSEIPLFELDRQAKYTYDTSVYLEKGNNSSFADLLRIMARLTAPDGCPWDKSQTHQSIRINLLEEAYETVDAITNDNLDGMIEELGDVLLQVVFHADIALRSGEFTLDDIIKRLNDKLIGRHTHIFGGDKANGADGALAVWERNKMKEKHQATYSDAVNDIPSCFPALLCAQKAAKRTEKGGWGRKNVQTLAKELCEALDKFMGEAAQDEDRMTELMGEALYTFAELCHKTGVNGEQALLDKVNKVQHIYTRFESAVLRDGKDVNALSDEEFKRYYDEAAKDEL